MASAEGQPRAHQTRAGWWGHCRAGAVAAADPATSPAWRRRVERLKGKKEEREKKKRCSQRRASSPKSSFGWPIVRAKDGAFHETLIFRRCFATHSATRALREHLRGARAQPRLSWSQALGLRPSPWPLLG